jgi:hypothetical protein
MRVGCIQEGGRQVLRAAAPRALAVLPFFLLAALVLSLSGRSVAPPGGRDLASTSPVVIATTRPLAPAFAALEEWNRKQGCPSYLLLVDDRAMSASPEEQIAYVSTLCARWGMAGILLGGDARHVPARAPDGVAGQGAPGSPLTWIRFVPSPAATGPLSEGLPVRRVMVRNLDEAWAFVEACRVHGQTLDEIVAGGISDPVARIGGEPFAASPVFVLPIGASAPVLHAVRP